jgi:DNA helicase HerA-like ATPase
VTLQVLAEGFSNAGVPVFMADVKGDLTGLCMPFEKQDFLVKRAAEVGLVPYNPQAFPVALWDLFGEGGHPVRTTVSEIGPLLMSRLLDLNDTQEGVMSVAFHMADEEGMLLLDLKDIQALLAYMGENASEISSKYGQVSKASVGAIQRALLQFEQQGGEEFFGEPALDMKDFVRTDMDGKGMVNILLADKLMQSPRLYSTFLLWMLSELFEEMPEAGDLDKPKLVFFFDEAHLLFKDAPKSLLEKIEQVVRLIRSKGVGIYFVTQNPQDIPESVLGQLGNRVQHALRAFTPQSSSRILSNRPRRHIAPIRYSRSRM